MTRPKIRDLAEKELQARVPGPLWEEFDPDVRDIHDALDGDEKSRLFDRLVGDLRKRLCLAPRAPRRSIGVEKVKLSPEERMRAEALSGFLARRAEREPLVVDYRRRYLSGRTITILEAKHFLGSLALGSISARVLERLRVPLVGHWVLPLGRTDPPRFRIEWPGGGVNVTDRLESAPGEKMMWMDLPYDDATDRLVWTKDQIVNGSVLHDLWRFGEAMRTRYPWDAKQTYLFLLTGKRPTYAPFSITWRRSEMAVERFQAALTVDLWAKAGTVRDAFQSLQRRYLGRANRQLSDKTVALFGLVDEMRAKGDLPSWPEITEAWNRRFPDWAETDYRHTRGNFERAERLLLGAAPRPKVFTGMTIDLLTGTERSVHGALDFDLPE